MIQRKLGKQGLMVSALGLGCMGLSWAYGPTNETESLRVLQRAFDLGINFFDTAEVYGPYANESLLGYAIQSQSRDKIIIATKFGFTWDEEGKISGLNSQAKHIKQSIEGSLKRLGTDYIDLYYQHRLDPAVPVEDTILTLAELVKEGKIRYIGLSEVSAATLRRAHAVHPITALQSEYSLWDRNVETSVLPTVRELGIGFVPFSPLGRGFLSGKIQNINLLDNTDFRRTLPRLQGEHLEHNLKFIQQISNFSDKHNITPSQLALAWLLKQGDDIVPIPGTKRIDYLEENIKSVDVHLPETSWDELNDILKTFQFQGERYPASMMTFVDKS